MKIINPDEQEYHWRCNRCKIEFSTIKREDNPRPLPNRCPGCHSRIFLDTEIDECERVEKRGEIVATLSFLRKNNTQIILKESRTRTRRTIDYIDHNWIILLSIAAVSIVGLLIVIFS